MGLHGITHQILSLCSNDFWHKEHMNINCCLNHNELKSSYKIWNVKNLLHYMEVTYYNKFMEYKKIIHYLYLNSTGVRKIFTKYGI